MNEKGIEKLAELAKIELLEEEKKKLGGEIEAILKYVSEICSIRIDKKTVASLDAHRNIFRVDEGPNETGALTEVLLEEAPRTKDGFIKVKKVL